MKSYLKPYSTHNCGREGLLELAFEKMKNSKAKDVYKNNQSYWYRGVVVEKLDKRIEMYDLSSDVYRPLSNKELTLFVQEETNVDKFVIDLQIKNTKKSLSLIRKLFHIAIAKKSEKDKLFYFRKAMRRIKKLRKLFDINNKMTKFVNKL